MISEFRNEYFFLSNYYNSPIILDGKIAPTVEHYFHACKTFNKAERDRILTATTPGKAKRLGRACTLRSDWETVKDSIMEEALRQKFESPILKQLLLSTGDEELVEGNWWNDTYWGVCDGVGQNKLGKLLMKLREEYKNEAL